jgi:phosphoglycolate phosphatase
MLNPLDYADVVFDWNGTIIDDVCLAVASVNQLCRDRGLVELTTDVYRQKFCFPIRDFYAKLGFDFTEHSFPALMEDYLALFDAQVGQCDLCPGVMDLLEQLHRQGTRISILSASHQDTLHHTARKKGVEGYLDHLFGLDASDATSKLDRARDLDCLLNRTPATRVLMIGDTDHDAQVAQDCGWDFLAVATGHQSIERLVRLGTPVLPTLATLPQPVDLE